MDDDSSTNFPDGTSDHTLGKASVPANLKIGAYRIFRKLGEGGMGEVYLAEQNEPIRRQVAVKVIRPGMDSRQVVARFEAERQALAMMEHPNISRVFDAGTTPEGRPYFVMEYVPGTPITRYCDRERLTIEERLELFMQVCAGVQHAHHKAIIHRDLKPSNILVTFQDGRPTPKIIDFGVAKATSHRLTEKTFFTEQGQLIGTPEYMSPEQADLNNENIDTRTDVYSLGVLLYELLSGALPFDPKALRSSGFDAIRRKIMEEDPAVPSLRLVTGGSENPDVARKRRTEPNTLARRIQGDLDWIVMRAMEKDRSRRYNSPGELATDIRRHLNDEPVLASPPSLAYRFRKFARRHRTLLAALSVLFVMLVVLAATMTYQTYRVASERDRANQEMRISQEVTRFLTGLFRSSDPYVSAGEELTVRQLLDRGAERINTSLSADSAIKAQLLRTIGQAYEHLGEYRQAESLYEQAVEVLSASPETEALDLVIARGELGTVYWRQGRTEEAEQLLAETYADKARLLGKEDPSTLNSANNLANLYLTQGRLNEAEKLYQESLELRTRMQGPDHQDTLGALHNLANVYARQGRNEEARSAFARVHQGRLRTLGLNHPHTLGAAANLADTYKQGGQFDEAERLHKETLEKRRQVLGASHPDTLTSMNNLAGLYEDTGRLQEAEALYVETRQLRSSVLGPDHPETLTSTYNLGLFYFRNQRVEEAEPLLSRAVAGWSQSLPASHPYLQSARSTLARLLYGKQDFRGAEEQFLEELAGYRSADSAHPKIPETLYNLACVAALQRENARSLQYLGEAVELGLAAEDILKDSDLENIRQEPEYARIAKLVQDRLR